MRSLLRLVVCLLLISACPYLGYAGEKPKSAVPTKPSAPAEPGNRPLPFRGNLKAVDKAAGTLTIGNRTFEVTAATKFFRGSQSARLEDGVKGEWTTGSYRRAEGDKLLANTVYFGGKSDSQGAPKSSSKPKKASVPGEGQ